MKIENIRIRSMSYNQGCNYFSFQFSEENERLFGVGDGYSKIYGEFRIDADDPKVEIFLEKFKNKDFITITVGEE